MVAHGRRADVRRLVVHARAVFGIANRQTRLQIDRLEHVDRVVELVGRDQVAVLAVERVDDAVTVRMGQKLALLAILVLLLREHHDVDASVSPTRRAGVFW